MQWMDQRRDAKFIGAVGTGPYCLRKGLRGRNGHQPLSGRRRTDGLHRISLRQRVASTSPAACILPEDTVLDQFLNVVSEVRCHANSS